MYLSPEQFKIVVEASMHKVTGAKQAARKKGFYGHEPLDLTNQIDGLCNGHVVEIALCHLLGIVQRYINYDFNVMITKELDLNGYDILIETRDYGTKNIQIKHTYRVGAREFVSGTYVVSTVRTGSELIKHFMEFYKLPLTVKQSKDIRRMYLELDYMWGLYLLDINDDYKTKF